MTFWELLNSPLGITVISAIVVFLLGKLWVAKPAWKKVYDQHRGHFFDAVRWAERTIPDESPNKSAKRLDEALRFLLKLEKIKDTKVDDLVRGIEEAHAASSTKASPPRVGPGLVILLAFLLGGCGEQQIKQQLIFVGDAGAKLRDGAAQNLLERGDKLLSLYLQASEKNLSAGLQARLGAKADDEGRIALQDVLAAVEEHAGSVKAREENIAVAERGKTLAEQKTQWARRLDKLLKEYLEQPDVSLDDASDMIEALSLEIPGASD